MSVLTERALTREARRILRKLVAGRRHLQRSEDGSYAIVMRSRDTRHAKMRVATDVAHAMRDRGWLAAKGDRLVLTDAGEGWLRRRAASVDPFAAQHQIRRRRIITDEQGREQLVTVNVAEAPLLWMYQRGMVSQTQCQAGERLRRDYTLARLAPRLAVDLNAPVTLGSRAVKPEVLLPDTVLAAKQRFAAAMRAVGPGLSDLLFEICCHLGGLEASERARGWPRASAKVVLRIALDRLAAHYGLNRRPARLRRWSMTEEGAENGAPTLQVAQGGGGQNDQLIRNP